jgi:hypothetical protein
MCLTNINRTGRSDGGFAPESGTQLVLIFCRLEDRIRISDSRRLPVEFRSALGTTLLATNDPKGR